MANDEVVIHVDFSLDAQERAERLWEMLHGVPISPARKEAMALASLETGLLIDGVPSPFFTMLTEPSDEQNGN